MLQSTKCGRYYSDADYTHAKKVFKDFEIKKLGEYVKSDTLLLADVFQNFRNICLEMNFTRIRMSNSFKKTKVKSDILADSDMLFMVETCIRR